tara:strand:+ start:860 stop:1549 length:690 start_codon:yes stop_codon:yes gene_type:complete
MNILCTICARAGSKGIKDKNLKKIKDKPLIFYTIKNAKNINIFNQIVISSDSKKVINFGKKFKVKNNLIRPKYLAKDNSPKIPVIRHALLEMEKKYNKKFSIIVDLDVTAPLRNNDDVKKALKKFKTNNYNTLFSVNIARKNPYYNCIEIKKKKILPIKKEKNFFTSRQEAPKVFEMNAAISIWNRKTLLNKNSLFTKNTGIYVMPIERSFDIDTSLDLEIVKYLLKKK